jgi:hypothetical protein
MKALFSFLLLLLFAYNAKCQNYSDSLFGVLKSEIAKKNSYDGEKALRINQLKDRLHTVEKHNYKLRYHIYNQLYLEYKEFVFDSAFVYCHKLLETSKLMRNLPKQYESELKLGAIQLSCGMFKETFDCFNRINPRLLPDSVKIRYYEIKSRAYTNLALFNTDKFYASANTAASLKALDSAIILAKPDSYEKYRHIAERLTMGGQKAKAVGYYKKLLESVVLTDHQRAMVAHDLSNLMAGNEKINLRILAAIYDIRSSTKETLAMFSLGKILFKFGDVLNAEPLLKEALSDARFYGNKLHETQIVAILTTVTAQKLINSENQKNRLLTYLLSILGIGIATTALISIIVYTRLKRVKLRELVVQEKNQHLDGMNKKLSEDALIKEEYIGYFFNVISGYIVKLEKIKRNVERKIKTKDFDELLKLAREIDIKQEREGLFYTFDHVFLKLFPNFISAFNSLLKPEDQIWPKDNEVLNTNLRIFALMRLGIKDNQTIADILENTVSTIYTYKIRIKSKALVPSADFDNKIMEIKFVDIDKGLPQTEQEKSNTDKIKAPEAYNFTKVALILLDFLAFK